MKNYIALIVFILAGNGFAQQRIGADFNTRLNSAYFTAQYHRVIKGPFLVTLGLGGGIMGTSESFASDALVINGFHSNPYPSMGNLYSNDQPNHKIRGTQVKGKGVSATAGIGFFKEFKKFHGLRVNLNHNFTMARSNVLGFYRNFEERTSLYKRHTEWHPVGSVSLELYHTIRMSGRNTFYWGVKLPYFYTMDRGRYNPKSTDELFNGALLDLSIGFTRSIGSCD